LFCLLAVVAVFKMIAVEKLYMLHGIKNKQTANGNRPTSTDDILMSGFRMMVGNKIYLPLPILVCRFTFCIFAANI
jgi:hypothetical protein